MSGRRPDHLEGITYMKERGQAFYIPWCPHGRAHESTSTKICHDISIGLTSQTNVLLFEQQRPLYNILGLLRILLHLVLLKNGEFSGDFRRTMFAELLYKWGELGL